MAPEPLTAPRKERRRLVTPGRIVAASVTLLGVLAPFVGAAETDLPFQAWVFIVCNVVIFSAYAFVAVFIAPLFPVRMPALVGAFGFFLFCGLTHFDMVFHTLFYRDRMWGDLVLDAHMLMVHIPQAIFVVVIARGFFKDLSDLRNKGVMHTPLEFLDEKLDQLGHEETPERRG